MCPLLLGGSHAFPQVALGIAQIRVGGYPPGRCLGASGRIVVRAALVILCRRLCALLPRDLFGYRSLFQLAAGCCGLGILLGAGGLDGLGDVARVVRIVGHDVSGVGFFWRA